MKLKFGTVQICKLLVSLSWTLYVGALSVSRMAQTEIVAYASFTSKTTNGDYQHQQSESW